MLLLLAAAVFPACDKPYIEYEEEENKDKVVVESSDDKSDSVDGDADYDDEGSVTDNGGNDNQDNEGSGDEFDIGDVVDVETFISTPIVNQIWLKGYIVGAATGANGKNVTTLRHRMIMTRRYFWQILLMKPTLNMWLLCALLLVQRKYARLKFKRSSRKPWQGIVSFWF